MRFHVFATDYDGTLSPYEMVTPDTIESLRKLKSSGRKLVLVTGRQIKDLINLFPEHILFDRIVAENGAILYSPATLEEKVLGNQPPESFIDRLRELKVIPLEIGRVIVATWQPNQTIVLEAIKEAGLEHQVIFNKGAVMILPPGINKSSGLHEALKDLLLSAHNTVAIGDAENDHAMLQSAEIAVAVQNALPTLKAEADWTTINPCNLGVMEVIDQLLLDDLASINLPLTRHDLQMGQKSDNTLFCISPYGNNILVAGSSCCGKTTFTKAFVEQLITGGYQFCLVDPEGDYLDLQGVLNMGNDEQPPVIPEVMKMMRESVQNLVVCVLAIPFYERAAFFQKLLANIADLYKNTGRPHFIIMDEAHHLIPNEINDSGIGAQKELPALFAITTKANLVHRNYLVKVDTLIIMGTSPDLTVAGTKKLIGFTAEIPKNILLQKGEILVWQKRNNQLSFVRSELPSHLGRRHKRKYASGDLGIDSFYFTGAERKFNIKASNLMMFIQIAGSIDPETWLFHLYRNDYSKWFRGSIKDEVLASRAEKIECNTTDAELSRNKIFQLIQNRYTGPG